MRKLPRDNRHAPLEGVPRYSRGLSMHDSNNKAHGSAVGHFLAISIIAGLLFVSCKREERDFRVQPPAAGSTYLPAVTDFHAGPTTESSHVVDGYDENAYAMQQGKLYYENFNCVGCHFHGGGGIGPPLMDDKWIYGSEPEQIFATIVQGRPNGMPSFRGKIPDDEVWRIVAYVRSLSGLANTDAAPGRSDNMQSTQPPNSLQKGKPVNSSQPPSSEMPS
jgi:cytochrome c oxidase cbb3-type subunit 3